MFTLKPHGNDYLKYGHRLPLGRRDARPTMLASQTKSDRIQVNQTKKQFTSEPVRPAWQHWISHNMLFLNTL
jgi:hypothetical protein